MRCARLVAAALAFAPHLQAGENLLTNASFEQVTPDGQPTAWRTKHGWYAQPKEKGLAKVVVDEAVFHGMGHRSIKIVGAGNRALIQQQLTIPFKPGERYRISGWIKLDRIRPASARFSAAFLGEGGKWITHKGCHTDWRVNTLDWRQHSCEFVVPDGAKYFQINLSTDKATNGTAWFDDMKLDRLDSQPKADPKTVAAQLSPAPQQAEGVVPLDDFEGETTKGWSSQSWRPHDKPKLEFATDNPYEGEQALRVTFYGTGCHALRSWPFVRQHWDAITFRIRRVSGSGRVLVNVTRGLGIYFRGTSVKPGPEWQKVTIRADKLRYGWGAKKDSQKTFVPEEAGKIQIAVDKPCAFEIDDMRLIVPEGIGLLWATHEDRGNLVYPGRPSHVQARLFNAHSQPKAASLDLVLRDLDGKTLKQDTKPVQLPPRSCLTVQHPLPALGPGFYGVQCTLRDGARIVRDWHVGVCSVPEPLGNGKGFFGASVFGLGAGNAEICARIGTRTGGVFFCWAWQERFKDRFEIGGEDKIAAFKDHGITPVGFINVDASRLPRWAVTTRKDDKGRIAWYDKPADWERWVRLVAEKFHKDIKHWSICCEVDLAHRRWIGGLDGYVDATRRACRVLKEVDPDCYVGGIGVSGVDTRRSPQFPIARALWPKLHDSLGGFCFDAYASPRTFGPGFEPFGPEQNGLDGTMREALAIVRKYGPDKRLAIHEKGWALDTSQPVTSTYARDFGDVIARSFVVTRGIAEIDEYMYFTIAGRSIERDHNYGLWHIEPPDLNPTPGVAAYATAARMLDDATQGQRVPLHDDIWAYVFRKPRGALAALWTQRKQDISLVAALPATATACNVAGTPVDVPRATGKANLTLTRSPIYIIAEGARDAALAAAIKASRYNLPCAKIATTMPSTSRLDVHLFAQTQDTVEGAVNVTLPAGWSAAPSQQACTLVGGETKTLAFALRMPAAPKHQPGAIEVVFQTKRHGRVVAAEEPSFFVARRLPKPPRIDGALDEYTGEPAVRLEAASNLGPSPDPAANGLWTGLADQSVDAWIGWDEQHFYLAARVRDDHHCQRYATSGIWKQDCLQIAFDPLNDAISPAVIGKAGFGVDDHEFGLALGPKGAFLHRWFGRSDAGLGNQANAKVVVKRERDATTYEWAVPWSELAPIKPAAGAVLGMGFVVPDSDDGGAGLYWMRMSEGIANGKNPAYYPNVVLAP